LSRREGLRLRDIVQAIETIRSHMSGEEFDRKTVDAILYNLVVIGEAAAQISDETRAAAPEIPWAKVVGLRNLSPTSTSGSTWKSSRRSSASNSISSNRAHRVS
jgi:uncharacterized protein with HEPN domain